MGSAASKPEDVYNNDEKHSYINEEVASLTTGTPAAPKSANGTLSPSNLASWESAVASDPKSELARTILQHTNIRAALTSRSARIVDAHVFNTEVPFNTGPVTNQKSSGRCWLFATTNVLRYDIMKKLKLKEFELSQVRPARTCYLDFPAK
jgi:bleomycin hydrolase